MARVMRWETADETFVALAYVCSRPSYAELCFAGAAATCAQSRDTFSAPLATLFTHAQSPAAPRIK